MIFNLDLDCQKTRDAFRLGPQSAFAASLCSRALKAISSDEKYMSVLSALLIVKPESEAK